jgi:hypothetical protein
MHEMKMKWRVLFSLTFLLGAKWYHVQYGFFSLNFAKEKRRHCLLGKPISEDWRRRNNLTMYVQELQAGLKVNE